MATNRAKRLKCVLRYTFSSIPITSQPAITCSKLTIETVEQGMKYVLVSLLLTLNIFYTLF